MTDQPHVLQAQHLAYSYRPGEPVLRDVSFTAAAGELVCLLGPNGSGKSTLLRCLLGLLTPAAGEVLLDGKKLADYSARGLARMLGYVPQFPRSAFEFTVEQIVLMGRLAHLGVLGLAGKADRTVAHLAMQMTHTLELAGRSLSELSGGEAQRVMIARALAQQPALMLLDEPTSHLDLRNQLLIHQMMQRLAHDWQMAVVCVSHDINLAAQFADRILLLRSGEILADGPPAAVIRADVLSAVYDVRIELIPSPTSPIPLVHAAREQTLRGPGN
ncbi:MAG: ABC transporter ATP-binding protein [Planctomycetota bacterium]|nr:ABC transporter ATP-binding protein [Planctomycetota bacterium]